MRRLLALALLIPSLVLGCGTIAACLAAPAALAAGTTSVASPSLNLSNAEQNASSGDTSTVASSSTTTSSSGLSGTDALLIAVVAVALLTGIAFWVWRDSRRHAAQVGHAHEDPMYGGRSHPGSKTPHKQRKLTPAERKRRKRGKAR